MGRLISFVILAAAALACSGKTEKKPAAQPASRVEPEAVKPAAAALAPGVGAPGSAPAATYACAVAADCVNSCSQGAVSKRWYEESFLGVPECDDGCNNQISDPPQCIEGSCVAFGQGKRRDHCTRHAVAIPPPGPPHQCEAAGDCMNSCAYGAVNKAWYASGPRSECKDGCVAEGYEPPRCEAGTCVAYRDGNRSPYCTRRPPPR